MSKAIAKFANSDYGVGITGKLNKSDPNNPSGDDNTVYLCIYDRKKETFYQEILKVDQKTSPLNKKKVIQTIIKMLLAILQ